MGSLLAKGQFCATLSRHNSLKDERHDELWQDFIKKVRYIAKNPKYKEIFLTVDDNTEDL